MAVDWVGAKPGIFINNSVVTPIDQDNLNSIVNTIDKIAQGGTDSGLDADTLQGKSLDSLITPSDESLINFYSFDALCNTSPCQIDDNSGNQKYGTAYNITPVKGVLGLAGSFNGTTSYASGSYLNLSALTISFWYKGGLNTSNKPLFILKKASNAAKIGVYNDNRYIKVIFTDADGIVRSLIDTEQLDAEFHQITVSHSGIKCSIYIDGILKVALSQTLTSLYYNEWVAGVNETQDNFSQMILDDIRIYNIALSDEEIYGQYITKIGAKVDSIVPKYISDTFVKLTGDETVAGVKTFSSSPVIPIATTSTQAVNYGQVVKNSGDETIAGVKTFSSSPIVPTASSSTQATNYGQVVKNTGNETVDGIKNFTSTPTVNSSPVRTDAIDSTIRSSISFTLPAMPDGARKRILNTHATNAITVTAYSGTTIEGLATMTLSAGHEVELELIGTDWRKAMLSQSDTPSSGKAMVWPDSSIKVWRSDNDGSGSGLDADLLDGAHRSAFMQKKQLSINDFNDITDSTLGPGETITFVTTFQPGNRPPIGNYYSGLISKQSDEFITVIAMPATEPASLVMRQMTAGVWRSWALVRTNLNDGSGSGLETDKIPFGTKTGTSTGTQGQASFDGNYLYLCTATNVWKRVALTSF